MNIERIRITLMEDTYAYIGRATNEENAIEFKNRLQQYIRILKEIIEIDFAKLTDKELYKLLSNVYDISLDKQDYLKMLSDFNNKNFVSIYRIPTTMTFTDRATEGHGRSFDWWNQLYQVYYIVAASDKFKFDYNKIYSKEEIQKMSSNKEIILLSQTEESIDNNDDFIQEEYEPLSMLNIDIKEYGDNISNFILDNYSLFGQLLRKRFTKKYVLKDIKQIINDLNEEMQNIFLATKSNDSLYSETARACKEWFDSSEEKETYKEIQKLLKKIIVNNL